MSGEPYSQLSRGTRRYRRKVASARQWQQIVAAKTGPCRVCVRPASNGHGFHVVTFHHLVPRSMGGDDVEDNIVPLCGDGTRGCHGAVTQRASGALHALDLSLSEAGRAYVVGKLGESGPARLFGVGR